MGKNKNKENIAPAKGGAAPTQVRCRWTDQDDEILLHVLSSEKAAGNQSESGWKKTVWNAAAAALAEEGIVKTPVKTADKVQDHFQNLYTLSILKQSQLKKEYSEIRQMTTSVSGFGWDDGVKRVIATEAVWKAKIEAKPSYQRWQNKTFIHYDTMSYLVEGIIATGAGAFNPGHTPRSSPPQSEHSASRNSTPAPEEVEGICGANSEPGCFQFPALDLAVRVAAVQDVSDQCFIDTPSSDPKAPPCRLGFACTGVCLPLKKKSRKSKGDKKNESLDNIGNALLSIGEAMNDSQEIDYQSKAIKMLEAEDVLSDEDMVQVFMIFSKDPNIAKMYCTIKHASLHTMYVSELLDNL
ncbi:hypothetical protein D9611_000191 [Ephemerocybe angulata]|uniref:Myb/SANT-like domain-containing protein n=1 Tax=Ephemerocybe angulata TaxID=980116 RepID=A0A8H5F6W9_9AGAR|nr:hypothetical protein D9611_000191 [Tulosesus angulatus]